MYGAYGLFHKFLSEIDRQSPPSPNPTALHNPFRPPLWCVYSTFIFGIMGAWSDDLKTPEVNCTSYQ